MNNHYTNRDFYLSAYLITQGFELKNHFRINHFTTFEFEDSSELQETINKFYSLQANVEPQSFSHAIKSLKTIIHGNDLSTAKSNTNNERKNMQFNSNLNKR